jgi:DNA-directed RNA polymerase specialized sigma24 family protein
MPSAVRGFRFREHDAEEVFQEVFARVYDRLGSLREDAALRPWIAQLTRRICLDRLADGSHEEPAGEIARPRVSMERRSRQTSYSRDCQPADDRLEFPDQGALRR